MTDNWSGDLNTRLGEAARRKARQAQLAGRVDQLRQELGAGEAEARRLRLVAGSEQADVDRLERTSLTSLLYRIVGTVEEKLRKEQQEALQARLRAEAAAARVAELERQLTEAEDELAGLRDASEEYGALLAEKERWIRKSSQPSASRLINLDAAEHELTWQLLQVQEALAAGERAGAVLRRMSESLRSAAGWGTWDLLGGGLLATAMKHSRIDEARDEAQAAERALAVFRRELLDVDDLAVPSVGVDGFTRFADYFLDGLIVDWVVQSEINRSQESVEGVETKVQSLLQSLRQRAVGLKQQAADLKAERARLVESL